MDVIIDVIIDIIRKLWDAQGYGNLAVWEDGTTKVVPPDYTGEPDGDDPLVVLKPIPLVGGYPMLDHALGDAKLHQSIKDSIKEAGEGIATED